MSLLRVFWHSFLTMVLAILGIVMFVVAALLAIPIALLALIGYTATDYCLDFFSAASYHFDMARIAGGNEDIIIQPENEVHDDE